MKVTFVDTQCFFFFNYQQKQIWEFSGGWVETNLRVGKALIFFN